MHGFKYNPCNTTMKNVKRITKKADLFSLCKLFTPIFLIWTGGIIEKMIFYIKNYKTILIVGKAMLRN